MRGKLLRFGATRGSDNGRHESLKVLTFRLTIAALARTFMKRVFTGELDKRLRKPVPDRLTRNPERTPLGVLAF
jgi:hypothetical protein